MANVFGYNGQVAALRGSPVEARLGSFKARIYSENHYRLTQVFLTVISSIYSFFVVTIARYDRAKIEAFNICYLNDFRLKRAFDVNSWEEIPLEGDLAVGALKIYRTTYKIIDSKGEEKEIPAIACNLQLNADRRDDQQECFTAEAQFFLYNGINFRGRMMPKEGIPFEENYWTQDLQLPDRFTMIDSVRDDGATYHMLQTVDDDHPKLPGAPVTSYTIGSSNYLITDEMIEWLSTLSGGFKSLADQDHDSLMTLQVLRKG